MPVTSNIADVIVSNCVRNLVPNKDNVFKEIFRTLKPGDHYLSETAIQQFRNSNTGIFSITVYAEKPVAAKSCCGPECCN